MGVTTPTKKDEIKAAFFGGRYSWSLAILAASKGLKVDVYVRDPGEAQKWQTERRYGKCEWLSAIQLPEALTVRPISEMPKFRYDLLCMGMPMHDLPGGLAALPRLPKETTLVLFQKGLLEGKLPLEVCDKATNGHPSLHCVGAAPSKDAIRGDFGMVLASQHGYGDQMEQASVFFHEAGAIPFPYHGDPSYVGYASALRPVLSLGQGLTMGLTHRKGATASTAGLILEGWNVEYQRILSEIYGIPLDWLNGNDRAPRVLRTDARICESDESRNYFYGRLLGLGYDPGDAIRQCDGVVEAASTLHEVTARIGRTAKGMSAYRLIAIAYDYIQTGDMDNAVKALRRTVTEPQRNLGHHGGASPEVAPFIAMCGGGAKIQALA